MARNFRICVFLSLGCCLSCVAASAVAADLRSSIDERTIVRTVSVQQATEVEPKPEPEWDSIPGYTTEEMGYDAGYLPSCGFDDCGRADQTWAGVEYLMWWRNGRYFPALVTTLPNNGTLPGATVLFGGGEIQEVARPGGRLEVGHWFDESHCLGIGGHLAVVADSPVSMTLTPNDLAFFAQPFFDASRNNLPVANPVFNVATDRTGQLHLQSGSEVLAADFFVRWLLWRNCATRLDLLCGYQFARINENLFIDTFTEKLQGITIAQHDAFVATNEYNAGHVGFLGEYRMGCWGLELLAKFGFGSMRQVVTIGGSTTVTTNGDVSNRASGLLAQSATNGGVHSQDTFSFMEDIGVKLAYYPTERLKFSLGYSLMYWSSVVRPGNEIDLSVDSRLFPPGGIPPGGPAATNPAFAFDPTHFLVHGLNLGAEIQF